MEFLLTVVYLMMIWISLSIKNDELKDKLDKIEKKLSSPTEKKENREGEE